MCCEDEMRFLMDNKVKEAFECLHCGKVVVRGKRTKEETWYAEIFSPHDVMKERR
jgi:transcription initiation factor IIE alpha subunit